MQFEGDGVREMKRGLGREFNVEGVKGGREGR